MRLSCRLELLPGRGIAERCDYAGQCGFEAVALPGRQLGTFREELERSRGRFSLPISSISLGFEGSLLSASEQGRAKCRESLKGLIGLCAECGIPIINMPPVLIQDNPERMRPTDPGGLEAMDAMLLGELPAIAAEAKRAGVTVCLEPVNVYETEYLSELRHAARLSEELGHAAIGITADFYHMQISETDAPSAVRSTKGWLKLVHVAGNTRAEPSCGRLDFQPGFRALHEIGYEGSIEIESRHLSGSAQTVLPESVDMLRRVWERTR